MNSAGREISGEGLRYLIVGGWNTVFGIGVFALLWFLLDEVWSYGLVLLVAKVIALLQAHWSQRTFVWRSKGSFLPELGRFALVYTLTYLANLGLLALSVEILGLPVLGAQMVITFLMVVVTFAVNRTWTFRRGSTVDVQ